MRQDVIPWVMLIYAVIGVAIYSTPIGPYLTNDFVLVVCWVVSIPWLLILFALHQTGRGITSRWLRLGIILLISTPMLLALAMTVTILIPPFDVELMALGVTVPMCLPLILTAWAAMSTMKRT